MSGTIQFPKEVFLMALSYVAITGCPSGSILTHTLNDFFLLRSSRIDDSWLIATTGGCAKLYLHDTIPACE